jgi:hypothetical protein
MPLIPIGYFALAIAAAVLCGAPSPGVAATRLTEFNGVWRGVGTDRNSPFESSQQSKCEMRIRADQTHLTSSTVCHGQYGLTKVMHFAVTLDGNRLTGSATQTGKARAGAASETLSGTVSGKKTDDMAALKITFPGLTPNADVVLKLIEPSSFSMYVGSHGLTLMDLIFHRQAARREP